MSRAAFERATPLARGWGVEVGLTVDVLRAGLRIVEVPCELHHRVSGRGWRDQLHRGRAVPRRVAGARLPAAAPGRTGPDPVVGRCRAEPDPGRRRRTVTDR